MAESSGISEPLPVAETFTFEDAETGLSLSAVARLDTCVTVVDSVAFSDHLHSMQRVLDGHDSGCGGDGKTLADLMMDQVRA
jgi:G3E family GTPase